MIAGDSYQSIKIRKKAKRKLLRSNSVKKPDPAQARSAVLAIADWIAADYLRPHVRLEWPNPAAPSLPTLCATPRVYSPPMLPGIAWNCACHRSSLCSALTARATPGECHQTSSRPARILGCVWRPDTSAGTSWWARQKQQRRALVPERLRSGCPSSSSKAVQGLDTAIRYSDQTEQSDSEIKQ